LSKTSKQWLKEHVSDQYVQRARREGYRSRAAYKLLEMDARDRLLGPGQVVVDLGAAPGSWSQVVLARTGVRGTVIAVDLLEIAPLPGLLIVQGDFREDAVVRAIEKALAGRPVDLVLCDMSPNISGIAVSDQARAMHLAELAFDFAAAHLKHGGRFLVKVFQGAGFEDFLRALRKRFARVAARKPAASRGRSSELYLYASGFSASKVVAAGLPCD
jgi:23S rRNA (uridine2552-2'-O)-methyltransferase